jgi:anti-sigma B factor antagonist
VASTGDITRSSSQRGDLTLSTSHEQSSLAIKLFGELDLATAPDLERAIERADGTNATEIVIDLSGLEFVDSTGLSVLIRIARRSTMNRGRLRLLRGQGQVEEVMTLCRLHERLPFAD